MMTIGEKGLALLKSFENLKLEAYMPTPHDVPTIGWGHTRGVQMGQRISAATAERLLREDLLDAEAAVRRNVHVPLTQEQFDALASLAFNVEPALVSSTLLRKLNSGDYAGTAEEFPRWNKQGGKVLNGLTRRRAAERALFLSGSAS